MSFTANIEEVVTENLNGLLSKHTTWCRVPLGQVAEVLNGFPFDSKRFVQVRAAPLIRIRDIVRGRTETFYDGEIPDGYWVEAGEILIGMDGDFNIARWKSERALLNQRVLKLSAKSSFYNERFLFFVVAGYLQAINEKTPSVTVKHLSSKTVLSIPLPLPPLAEQTRIAQKLDELLAQVDTLKARIDGIPVLLKRFRQSVLAAAVSGRLTEEWREKNTGDLGFLLNPKAKALGIEELASAEELLTEPLPTFWKKYALEQLVEPDRGIPYGIVQTGSAVEKGIPTVRCGDVKNLFIDTSSLKKVSPEIEHEYKRTRLKGGEVLLAIRGSVGNAGVVPAALRDCNISREVAMIPTLPSVLPFYLACLLQSPLGQRLLVGKVRGVAQKGINLADVRRLPVALPPYAEQTEIVHRVEKLFAFADQLETKVASAKSRIDHLTQSILAKAFRGELVPQDPNDEPASVLLERIQAQRAAAPKARQRRKV